MTKQQNNLLAVVSKLAKLGVSISLTKPRIDMLKALTPPQIEEHYSMKENATNES